MLVDIGPRENTTQWESGWIDKASPFKNDLVEKNLGEPQMSRKAKRVRKVGKVM